MTIIQKGEPMAEIKVPIQVNLPDDWVEQIVDRLRNDPDAEWVEIIRCKDCKHFAGEGMYCSCDIIVQFDHFYCYHAERRQDV